MDNCIFCKIVAGEIPSTKIFEDETVLVFADINPAAPTHYLIIPKTHIPNAASITADLAPLAGHMMEVVGIISKQLGEPYFRLISNCGASVGQTVDHLHFHFLAGPDISSHLLP